MSQIGNFPDGDALWLVKWIDGIRLASWSTTSASVAVLLQKLSIRDPAKISTLKPHDLALIFTPTDDTRYQTVHILVGTLPYIEIGDIFQSATKVARLPGISLPVSIPLAEASCVPARLANQEPPPYEKWEKRLPYRVLNNFEYLLNKKQFADSNFLVFKSEAVDYVIPKSVIFKTFYAQNWMLAQAFTNGSWPNQSATLVCMKELESGLYTGIDEATGEWNIVLQLKVPEHLTPLLGVFLFDEYGKKCASSIYTSIFQTRRSTQNDSWFIDAKIPFVTTPENPLRLVIRGFELKRYSSAEEEAPTRILVTGILRSSLPSLPTINQAYVINGQKGEQQFDVDAPAPFTRHANIKPVNQQTSIESDADSHPSLGATEIPTSSFSWIDPPQVRKMHKTSSKSYNKSVKSSESQNTSSDHVSPGNNTYSSIAKPEAHIKLRIRQPDKIFEELIAILRASKRARIIFDYKVFSPLRELERIEIAELECWNFLGEEARMTGIWPQKGWRMKNHAGRVEGGGYTFGQPRAALVIQIFYTEFDFGYWIEIEHKTTTFLSPYIQNAPNHGHQLIGHFIEILARTNGSRPTHHLSKAASDFGLSDELTIVAYKHTYEENGALSLESVLNFLKKNHKK